jgi:mRNA-degrading endonuclease toxin of MazEF toxin-antitoxin module
MDTGLPKDSVANVSLIVSMDKRQLTERVGKLNRRRLELVLTGIDVGLGR